VKIHTSKNLSEKNSENAPILDSLVECWCGRLKQRKKIITQVAKPSNVIIRKNGEKYICRILKPHSTPEWIQESNNTTDFDIRNNLCETTDKHENKFTSVNSIEYWRCEL